MDAISDIAPCSISELAFELGRSPQSLYYHIDILREVGLINQVGSRKAGKRDEALGWQMAQPSVDLCHDGRLELIEDAGHFVALDAPERVNALLLDFLT